MSGSMLACSSPNLFAAYRVLHRLSMPRHPPYALCSLTSARYFAALLCCFLLAFGRRTFNVRLNQARRCASSCDKITSHLSLAIKGIIQWYMMLLVFSNYPKMWFYLQLKIVFTLSFFGLVKSISCFCVVFKVHLLVIFPHYFVASSSPSVNVPFYVRFGQVRRCALSCNKIPSRITLFWEY